MLVGFDAEPASGAMRTPQLEESRIVIPSEGQHLCRSHVRLQSRLVGFSNVICWAGLAQV